MRITWLLHDQIAAAREALTAGGATWDDHFSPTFQTPQVPTGLDVPGWEQITEHVARAERISEVVRERGYEAAYARFGGSGLAIEEATLAAAAHAGELLGFEQVISVLACPIDVYVFYGPYLEILIELGKGDLERTVATYEAFVASYAAALVRLPGGTERVDAVRDGLADFYVSAGRTDAAEALYERRHDEDRADVAVALSASRAFLAAGAVSHAVRWLGVGAARAADLGREELAERLRTKQQVVRRRLS